MDILKNLIKFGTSNCYFKKLMVIFMEKKFSIILILITLIIGFNLAYAEKVTILHVNDSHSYLLPGGERGEDLKANLGGISKFATVANSAREADSEAILLHAGDFSIGDIMYCNFLGILELGLISQLQFNAITLGNHEFDLGPEALQMVLTGGLAGSNTKVLCANGNFDNYPDLKSMIQDTLTIMANGVKVGVFGITTPNTVNLSNPGNVSFDNEDFLKAKINSCVTALKNADCKIIIMLSHQNFLDDLMLSQELSGIDAIIGGHDHYVMDTFLPLKDGSLCKYVQAGSFYQWTGKFVFDVTDDKVTLEDYTLIPLDESVAQDELLSSIVNSMTEEVESKYSKYGPVYSDKLAIVEETYDEFGTDLHKLGYHDSDVGNLVCDAFKSFGKTDIGITASGFTGEKLYKGHIVGSDVYRINGYGFNEANTLGFPMCTFEISGEDIKNGLRFGMGFIRYTDDYLIQCSDNMYFEYEFVPTTPDSSFGDGLLGKVIIDGVEIVNDKKYSVTTNVGIYSFLADVLGIPVDNFNLDKDMTTEYMVLVNYIKNTKDSQEKIKPLPKKRIECVDKIGGTIDEETKFSLKSQAYPNPCNISTTLEFEVENPDNYFVLVIDNHGKTVFQSTKEYYEQGQNLVSLNTEEFSNGTYIYLITNGFNRYYGRFVVSR